MNIIYFDELGLLDNNIKKIFEKAANLAARKDGVNGDVIEISVSIVDKTGIKALNREYRGIDKETDVLSFPQYESLNEIKEIDYEIVSLGDVVICLDKANEQAKEFGHSLERELVYLFVHSIFHLLGYDHLKGEEKIEMRKNEERIMQMLNIVR